MLCEILESGRVGSGPLILNVSLLIVFILFRTCLCGGRPSEATRGCMSQYGVLVGWFVGGCVGRFVYEWVVFHWDRIVALF